MTLTFVLCGMVLPLVLSFLLVSWIHPIIVRLAFTKDLVDLPGQRKLQRRAIPVMGGFAVFWGIVLGMGFVSAFFDNFRLFPVFVAITVMMYIGTIDDMISLSPHLRFLVEILVVLFLIKLGGYSINNLHGVFGIHELPLYVSVPLSVFAGVGIINAINLIDGVDGLSSGFCIVVSLIFGFAFVTSSVGTLTALSISCVGSLLPFLMHNVFGRTSKMFIGDSGTLMLGTIIVFFVFRIVDTRSEVANNYTNMGVLAFTLSVLSVPVFDTLRVMASRIARGRSPFSPDKSHLHHLFIDIGFSHVGTAVAVNIVNLINFGLWLLAYQLGASATVQLLLVLLVGFLTTTGFYYTVRRMGYSRFPYRVLRRIGRLSHIEGGEFFKRLQTWIDKY